MVAVYKNMIKCCKNKYLTKECEVQPTYKYCQDGGILSGLTLDKSEGIKYFSLACFIDSFLIVLSLSSYH